MRREARNRREPPPYGPVEGVGPPSKRTPSPGRNSVAAGSTGTPVNCGSGMRVGDSVWGMSGAPPSGEGSRSLWRWGAGGGCAVIKGPMRWLRLRVRVSDSAVPRDPCRPCGVRPGCPRR